MASVESSKTGGGKEKLKPKPVSPGTIALPLARVQRIIKKDRDVNKITNEASWAIAKATVLFYNTIAYNIRSFF
jgi:hypothetical protein